MSMMQQPTMTDTAGSADAMLRNFLLSVEGRNIIAAFAELDAPMRRAVAQLARNLADQHPAVLRAETATFSSTNSAVIDTATARELRDLFCMDDDDELAVTIRACDGTWTRDGDVWHFRLDPDVAPVPLEFRQ